MAKKRRKVPRYLRQAESKQPIPKPRQRIPADPSKQAPNNSYSPPTYYEDMEFECLDCGKREIWTAKQQQWWYEEARGSIYACAIRCRSCRQKRRAAREEQRHRSEAGRSKKSSL